MNTKPKLGTRKPWAVRIHDPECLIEIFGQYITEPTTAFTIPKRARDVGRPRHELDMAIGTMD